MIGGFGCGVGVSLLLFLEEWCEYCCARICAARLFMIMLGRLAGESVGWLVGGGGLPVRRKRLDRSTGRYIGRFGGAERLVLFSFLFWGG